MLAEKAKSPKINPTSIRVPAAAILLFMPRTPFLAVSDDDRIASLGLPNLLPSPVLPKLARGMQIQLHQMQKRRIAF
jgi:hypothetical protein